jgi:tRNA (cmo5U34)-methyltransferase
MRSDEIKAIFDQQASRYDEQWAKTAPIRDGLHFLLEAVFAELPANARILCVGAGTGEEMAYLAKRFPQWSFAAVEPSGAMLDVCRNKADKEGFISRCYFHEGYLDSLPIKDKFDAATCFLVSQFILEQETRAEFFRAIAVRLRPEGILASSDLASEVGSSEYEAILHAWLNMMVVAGIPPEGIERMRAAYAKDVAILPPAQVASIIESGGFGAPVKFYQAGLIHAWFSKCASSTAV